MSGLVLPAIIGAVGGLAQSGLNYASQYQNLDYQKKLQQQIFEREDNAVQRRVADLKSAGLSKTLAAGDGAGAGSVVSTSAPKSTFMDDLINGISLAQSQADLKAREVETENALIQGRAMEESILSEQLNRDYTRAKLSLELGKLDMLPLNRQQLESSITLTNKQIEEIDEVIKASILGRSIDMYKLHNVLPNQALQSALEVGMLRKQGAKLDSDIAYRRLESDLLAYNLSSAMWLSKIHQLDYNYQALTGLKPGTGGSTGSLVGAGVNKGVDLTKAILSFFPWSKPKSSGGGRSW